MKKNEANKNAAENENKQIISENLTLDLENEKKAWELKDIRERRQNGEFFDEAYNDYVNRNERDEDDEDDEGERKDIDDRGSFMVKNLGKGVTESVLQWVDGKLQQAGNPQNPQQVGNVQNPQNTNFNEIPRSPPSFDKIRRATDPLPDEQEQQQEQAPQINNNSVKKAIEYIPVIFTQEQLEPLIKSLKPDQINFFNNLGVDVNQFLEVKAKNKK